MSTDPAARTPTMTSAERMKEIVGGIAPLMKEAGFRKKANAFNRRTDSGIVHVLNFQVWRFVPDWPPDPVADAEQRANQTFTINLSLWVPELTELEAPAWVHEAEYGNAVRARIGAILPGPSGDHWWRIHDRASDAVVRSAVVDHALPWLDRMRTTAGILAVYEEGGPQVLGWGYLAHLRAARLYLLHGDRERAEAVVREVVRTPINPPHHEWLVETLADMGFGDYGPQIVLSAR